MMQLTPEASGVASLTDITVVFPALAPLVIASNATLSAALERASKGMTVLASESDAAATSADALSELVLGTPLQSSTWIEAVLRPVRGQAAVAELFQGISSTLAWLEQCAAVWRIIDRAERGLVRVADVVDAMADNLPPDYVEGPLGGRAELVAHPSMAWLVQRERPADEDVLPEEMTLLLREDPAYEHVTFSSAPSRDSSSPVSQRLWQAMLRRSNDRVELQELFATVLREAEWARALRQAFATMDADGSGVVTYSEFEAAVAQFGPPGVMKTLADAAAVTSSGGKRSVGAVSWGCLSFLFAATDRLGSNAAAALEAQEEAANMSGASDDEGGYSDDDTSSAASASGVGAERGVGMSGPGRIDGQMTE
jgi:hypothetical protein